MANMPAPSSGDLETVLAALQHALNALGSTAALVQQESVSKDNRVAWGLPLDSQHPLIRLFYFVGMAVSSLLNWLFVRKDLLQPLLSSHHSAFMGALTLALQVQVRCGCTALPNFQTDWVCAGFWFLDCSAPFRPQHSM